MPPPTPLFFTRRAALQNQCDWPTMKDDHQVFRIFFLRSKVKMHSLQKLRGTGPLKEENEWVSEWMSDCIPFIINRTILHSLLACPMLSHTHVPSSGGSSGSRLPEVWASPSLPWAELGEPWRGSWKPGFWSQDKFRRLSELPVPLL